MLGSVTDAWGITEGYHDIDGTWHATADTTRAALRDVMGDPSSAPPAWCVQQGATPGLWGPCTIRLEDGAELGPVRSLPPDLPIGYHDLVPVDGGPVTFLVVAPPRVPDAPRASGLSAQLYSLRSAGSQGIGDLGDLAALLAWAAREGAGAVLISPLHAPSPTFPQQDSPYYASSRVWMNPLHIRVPGLPEDLDAPLVDRDAVWALKRSALRSWFITSSLGGGWRRWVDAQGPSLWQHAQWCALAERNGPVWQQWPAELAHPDAAGIAAMDPEDFDVEFHAWCQWLVSSQLAQARRTAPDVALIGDLAVGFDPCGSDAWRFQHALTLGWRVGSPPDMFNRTGQDWGLPPFNPIALRTARFAPFIETVRAAMRQVAGVRLDHVMGLFRLWCIPPGADPAEGAYVRQPSDVLLGVVRVEAHRAGVFVVGEDLGTVEDGVRESLHRCGILGTRVAWFDSDPPQRWPEECLGTITTHDLPTIAGVWLGSDGDAAMRDRLTGVTRASSGALSQDVTLAAHEALARSPARLRLATLEDLCGVTVRPNVPGTVNEFPNWRRRLPLRIEDFARTGSIRATMQTFREASRG